MKRVVVVAVVVALAGCENVRAPWGQANEWRVSIEYNLDVPKVADRIRIDVLDARGELACDDCTHEISPSGFGDSFSVAKTDSLVRIRARLFSSFRGDVNSGGRMIDVVARLPERDTWTARHDVVLPLPFGCFGRPPKLEEGITCQMGAGEDVFEGPEPILGDALPPPLATGGCTKTVPKGMACVGFGSFLLGSERVSDLASDLPSRPEIAVRIPASAALMLDKDEMDVGTVRRLLQEGKLTVAGTPASSLLLRDKTLGSPEEECNFNGVGDTSRDKEPMNCIGRDLAADVCRALGKRLPSEAEWEFAAGNGPNEAVYPWDESSVFIGLQDEDEICILSHVGHGRASVEGEYPGCIIKNKLGRAGPVRGGNPDDITLAGVYNLGGNVGEWVSDEVGFYDEDCRSVLSSGPCTKASSRLQGRWVPYRGGSWARPAQSTITTARFVMKDGAPSPYVGFRCAVSEDELP